MRDILLYCYWLAMTVIWHVNDVQRVVVAEQQHGPDRMSSEVRALRLWSLNLFAPSLGTATLYLLPYIV